MRNPSPNASGLAFLVLLATTALWWLPSASSIYHNVGGSHGWSLPPNQTFFQDWAKPRVFGVEDSLLFPFRSAVYNVVEVEKESFDGCKNDKVIAMYTRGPLILNFTQPGDHYYYSGIGIQCELGMKLHITVVAGKGNSGRSRNLLSDHDHDDVEMQL
ncbi:mavicyanin-like [Diospyros lotus]|uniref:mavicyanin-like n=1 Tax=Diospyros lotus TaxID=55363 RepID=UPI00224F7A33|nr:mavicyanin-like [Diospyros lotus]